MKKLVFLLAVIIFVSLTSFALAQDAGNNEETQINKAYSCLKNKVQNKCASLPLQDQIFSLLALNYEDSIKTECKNGLESNEKENKCWPKSKCSIKETAQAILALNEAGESTDAQEEWLMGQTTTPDDLVWYLQTEVPSGASQCTVSYDEKVYNFNINEDKTLSGSAGSCLKISSSNNYWLKIDQNCLDKQFTISCQKDFITSLLYRKKGSATIYVSNKINEGSGGGETKEKVEIKCFSTGRECDYEGSLWAAFVLDKEHDVKDFLPYLIANAEENEKFLPEAFLSMLTDSLDYELGLKEKQKFNEYWEESGDKFYDTALALLALDSASSEEEKAKEYLISEEAQDKEGCWGTIRDTGFLLYAGWPKSGGGGIIPPEETCEDGGYYCMPAEDCDSISGAEVRDNLECTYAFHVCCTKRQPLQDCEDDLGGEVCESSEECFGSEIDSLEGKCCVGSCRERAEPSTNECEMHKGECKAFCEEEEEESGYDCPIDSDKCCKAKVPPETTGVKWTWIVVLLILIALTILAILKRDKLRMIMFRFRRGGAATAPKKPGFPGEGIAPRRPTSRIMPRRIIPRRAAPPSHKPPIKTKDKELEETLRKLREIGK